VLAPSQDNTIWEGDPTTSNGAGIHVFAGSNGHGEVRRALLKFDLAGQIPTNSTVTSVSLQLTETRQAAGAGNAVLSLHRLTAGWGEGISNAGGSQDGGGTAATANDVTWTFRFLGGERWTTAGGDFAETASAQTLSSAWASNESLIADVQAWLADPESNHGWIILGDESKASTARQFGSREISNVDQRPKLTITYE
jgi:hypothetical protein